MLNYFRIKSSFLFIDQIRSKDLLSNIYILGIKSSVVISKLLAAHQEGNANACFNIEAEGNADSVTDAVEKEVLELLALKYWALKYATDAACTILRVDQIIMAKRAGGPKPKAPGPMDQDDD